MQRYDKNRTDTIVKMCDITFYKPSLRCVASFLNDPLSENFSFSNSKNKVNTTECLIQQRKNYVTFCAIWIGSLNSIWQGPNGLDIVNL